MPDPFPSGRAKVGRFSFVVLLVGSTPTRFSQSLPPATEHEGERPRHLTGPVRLAREGAPSRLLPPVTAWQKKLVDSQKASQKGQGLLSSGQSRPAQSPGRAVRDWRFQMATTEETPKVSRYLIATGLRLTDGEGHSAEVVVCVRHSHSDGGMSEIEHTYLMDVAGRQNSPGSTAICKGCRDSPLTPSWKASLH